MNKQSGYWRKLLSYHSHNSHCCDAAAAVGPDDQRLVGRNGWGLSGPDLYPMKTMGNGWDCCTRSHLGSGDVEIGVGNADDEFAAEIGCNERSVEAAGTVRSVWPCRRVDYGRDWSVSCCLQSV